MAPTTRARLPRQAKAGPTEPPTSSVPNVSSKRKPRVVVPSVKDERATNAAETVETASNISTEEASTKTRKAASKTTRGTKAKSAPDEPKGAPKPRGAKRKRDQIVEKSLLDTGHEVSPGGEEEAMDKEAPESLEKEKPTGKTTVAKSKQPARKGRPRKAAKTEANNASKGAKTLHELAEAAIESREKTTKETVNQKAKESQLTQPQEVQPIAQHIPPTSNLVQDPRVLSNDLLKSIEHLQQEGVGEPLERFKTGSTNLSKSPIGENGESLFFLGFSEARNNPDNNSKAFERGTSSAFYRGFQAGRAYVGENWLAVFTEAARIGLPAEDFLGSGCVVEDGKAVVPEGFEFERSSSTYDERSKITKTITIRIISGEADEQPTQHKRPRLTHTRTISSDSLPCCSDYRKPSSTKLPEDELNLPTLPLENDTILRRGSRPSPEPRTSAFGDLFLADPSSSSRSPSYHPFESDEEDDISLPPQETQPSLSTSFAPPPSIFSPTKSTTWSTSQQPLTVTAPVPQPALTAPLTNPFDAFHAFNMQGKINPGLPQISGVSYVGPPQLSPGFGGYGNANSMQQGFQDLPGLGREVYRREFERQQENEKEDMGFWQRAVLEGGLGSGVEMASGMGEGRRSVAEGGSW